MSMSVMANRRSSWLETLMILGCSSSNFSNIVRNLTYNSACFSGGASLSALVSWSYSLNPPKARSSSMKNMPKLIRFLRTWPKSIR
ncbi:hypothetical protein D3C72_2077050 [compost metagenome]